MFKAIWTWLRGKLAGIKAVLKIVLVALLVLAVTLPGVIVGFRIGWQARGFHDKIERSPFVDWLKPKPEAPQETPKKERSWLVPQKKPPDDRK